MKRIISLLLPMMLCLSVFSGCEDREIIPPEYTYELLVEKERPDESLVWAGKMETPRKFDRLSVYSESSFWGMLSQENIHVMQREQRKHINPHANGLVEDCIAKYYKIITRSSKRKILDHYIADHNCLLWEDATLLHFYVPEDDSYDEEPTKFAGKYVFIEYRKREDKVYIQTLAPEEYHDGNDPFSVKSECEGRIGNIYYLSDGYYDLTEHTYKTYEDESELPKYRMDKQKDDRNIRDILREDVTLAEYLEGEVYSADTSYRLNDRIYAAFVIGENAHDAPIEEYEGSSLLLVMLDADTYEVLYAEAYHSTNYYLGAMSERIAMYRQGADGFLYDPYILE